jgi:hypothetical protein
MSKWLDHLQAGNTVFAADGRTQGSAKAEYRMEDVPDGTADPDRFDALMSLALDGQLSADEESEFDGMLALDPSLADVWDEWQGVDFAFRTAPHVEPPRDFVASFEDRLVRQERRRRVWIGAGIGAIALLLWSGLVVGMAGAGVYVMFNEYSWLTGAVRAIVQTYAAVESQIFMLSEAFTTAFSTPEGQGMAIAYITFAGVALWFWARMLRRSVNDATQVAASVS